MLESPRTFNFPPEMQWEWLLSTNHIAGYGNRTLGFGWGEY